MAEACEGWGAPGLCPGPRDIYEQKMMTGRDAGSAAMIRGAWHG